MALNIHFENRFAPLDAIFNYMIFLEDYQKCLEGISFVDARLLHFAGAIKPWNDYDPRELAERAPQVIKFVDVWRELLDEARVSDPRARMTAGFQRQKERIETFNRSPLKARGRLY